MSSMASVAAPNQSARSGDQRSHASAALSHCARVVCLNFSESNEFKTKAANRVDVINLWITMLGRAPSTAQLDGALATLTGGQPLTAIVDQILRSSAYATRVGG